jgi:hypothetical protein
MGDLKEPPTSKIRIEIIENYMRVLNVSFETVILYKAYIRIN